MRDKTLWWIQYRSLKHNDALLSNQSRSLPKYSMGSCMQSQYQLIFTGYFGIWDFVMMSSQNGNTSCVVTGPLWGESTGHVFDLRLNKRLSIQSRSRWFETSSRSLWRHCNDNHRNRAIWKWTQVSNFDWYREKLRLGRKYLITIMMQELLIEPSHEFHFIWLEPNEKEHVCILALQMESFISEIFTLHQSTVTLLIQYYAPYDISTSFIIHIYFLNLRTPLSSDWATSQPVTDDVTHVTSRSIG